MPHASLRLTAAIIAILVAIAPARCTAANYALVVGVNECPDFRLPGGQRPRQLRGAENDADAICRLLTGQFQFPPTNVSVLKGAAATYAGIREKFLSFKEKLTAGDQFVFHFSGHGTQLDDQVPFDEQQDDKLDEALCPYDVIADGKGLIRDDELAKWLEGLSAGRITVILDCCHAGTATKADDSPEADEFVVRYLPMENRRVVARAADRAWQDLEPLGKGPSQSIVALFACGSSQPAVERQFLELNPSRMGQFTRYLVLGLSDARADANGDGQVSVAEIMEFVQAQIDRTFNQSRRPVDWQIPSIVSQRSDWPMIIRQ
jgi:uncharacterized caspase-like protein